MFPRSSNEVSSAVTPRAVGRFKLVNSAALSRMPYSDCAALPVLPSADRVARTGIFLSTVFPSMTGAGPANARNNHFGKTRRVSIISNWRDIIIPSVVTLVHSITPVENAQRSGFALQQAPRHYGVLIAR